MARKFHYFVADDRIVFQQEGLNTYTQQGYVLYARIIIETTFGTFDDYAKQTDDFSETKEELSELSNAFEEQVKENFKGTGLHVVKWNGVSVVKVNDCVAIKMSYIRQLNDNPTVYVEVYQFHNNDRLHTVTLSYRQKDNEIWDTLFSKVINSFNLTNIK